MLKPECIICGVLRPLRPKSAIAILIAGCQALFAVPAALAAEWNIGYQTAPQVGPAKRALWLSGSWPNRCLPELLSAEVDGARLDVLTRSSTANCAETPTRFELPVSASTALPPNLQIHWRHQTGEDPPALLGFRLFAVAGTERLQPDSGWWWAQPGGEHDTGGPGTGMTVDVQQGLATIITQAFDESGHPEWQLASGSLNGNVFNGPLYLFRGGQTLSGDYRQADIYASNAEISILFQNHTAATVWFSQRRGDSLLDPIELRPLSMVRYIMNPPMFNRLLIGNWLVMPAKPVPGWPDSQRIGIHALRQLDDGHIELLSAGGDIVGYCENPSLNEEHPPEACHFSGLDAYGEVTFKTIGYDRWRGHTAEYLRMVALRIE